MGNKIPLIFPVLMGGRIKYLLRDDFSADLAAGSVNGTLANPGGSGGAALNTRTVVDTGNRLSIGSGVVSLATGGAAAGDPGLWYGAITRAAGQILMGEFTMNTHTGFGIDAGQTGGMNARIRYGVSSIDLLTDSYSAGLTASTAGLHKLAIVIRAAGLYVFMYSATSNVWKLLWADTTSTTTPYYIGFGFLSAGYQACSANTIRYPETKWLPTALAYDTFTRANGAIGSTETTGPDGLSALAPALTALAWASDQGTWTIVDTAKALCTPLDGGGIGVGTVDVGTRSVHVSAVLSTIAGGYAGVVASYVDSSNYIYAYHDGTNAVLGKVVGGSDTGLVTAAATYGSTFLIKIIVDGNSVTLFYNNAKIGTTQTVSDAGLLTGTKVGLYSTNTGNKLDAFTVYPIGLEGQHSALNPFLA